MTAETEKVAATLQVWLRSGVRLSSFRVLDVHCANNHRLAQVLDVQGELVAIFKPIMEPDDGRPGRPVYVREGREAVMLSATEPGAWLTATCRCSAQRLTVEWLGVTARSGTRRVQAPDTPNI